MFGVKECRIENVQFKICIFPLIKRMVQFVLTLIYGERFTRNEKEKTSQNLLLAVLFIHDVDFFLVVYFKKKIL